MIMNRLSNLKKDYTVQVSFDEDVFGRIETGGPGKNVLLSNKYASTETKTQMGLKILDHTEPDSSDEEDYDPYNSGSFDMSKIWGSDSHE